MTLLAFLLSSLLALSPAVVGAASTTALTGTASATATDGMPTGTDVTYINYDSTASVPTTTSPSTSTTTTDTTSGTMSDFSSIMAAANSSTSSSSSSTSITLLTGGAHTTANTTARHNATSTTSVLPTNTQPCNGHPEFCTRRFSNITYVAAHNSPFIRSGNAAANQVLDVTTQLNDGVRMLQFQTHLVNGTMYLCHTSCDLLNAGTLVDYLTTVRRWLAANPYDVITILMGNDDLVNAGNYTAPFADSGLMRYVYTPSRVPMAVRDWPILSEMILTNKRLVTMLDYNANQTAIPWLMDEFGQMWESPFSPTQRAFPCTAERPPPGYAGALPRTNRMFMANHNLNVDLTLGSFSLLVPVYTLMNETNAATETYGSLATMANNCTATWGRPPNYLLVDYYNYGNFNGSVFQVAANLNNVTYNRDSCCGRTVSTSAASGIPSGHMAAIASAVVILASYYLLLI